MPSSSFRNAARWRFTFLERGEGQRVRLGFWDERAGADGPACAVRPTLVIFPGRVEPIEKYGAIAGHFSARGFVVAALDWRGQGGSSRMLDDPHKGYIDRFETYLEDLDAALPLLTQKDSPLLALAHSMGGHLALRHLLERPQSPLTGLVACAPMLGLHHGPVPEAMAAAIPDQLCALGWGERYAFGQGPWRSEPPAFEGNRLTGDADRLLDSHRLFLEHPDLILAGATWAWVKAAYHSIDHFWAAPLEMMRTPVLILSGLKDRVVRADAHAKAVQRLGCASIRTYPEGRHELLMETDAIRDDVLAAAEAFLAPLAGMDRTKS
jgi:lysophospholipase